MIAFEAKEVSKNLKYKLISTKFYALLEISLKNFDLENLSKTKKKVILIIFSNTQTLTYCLQ